MGHLVYFSFLNLGEKYDEREKKRRAKRIKKRKRGEERGKKREKINNGKNYIYDKICYLRGEKIYISPQSVRYLLGGKNISSRGGSKNMTWG